MNHIRDKLPDMKARLNTLMGQAQQELNSFGDAAIFGDKNQVGFTLHCTIECHPNVCFSKAP
jgi:dynamin 1-like protein